MKKSYLLLSILFLSSCGGTTTSSVEASEQNSVNENTSMSEVNSNNETVSESEVTSEMSSISEENTLPNDVVDFNKITIGLNDSYNLTPYIKEEHKSAFIEYYVDNQEIAAADVKDNINGLKVGTTFVDIYVNEEVRQRVEIEVSDKLYEIKMDMGRMYGKNSSVYGTSIDDETIKKDVAVSTYWTEHLRSENAPAKVYNFAKSGATVGYSVSMEKSGALSIVGTTVVKTSDSKDGLKDSQYALLHFGGNDYWRQVTKGSIGDINDSNYINTESFVGSLSYMVDYIKSVNPSIQIVLLSTTYSTWSFATCTNYSNKEKCIQTQEAMNDEILNVAKVKGCYYVDMFDLWTASKNTDVISRDGIHPNDKGHQLMVDRILGKI